MLIFMIFFEILICIFEKIKPFLIYSIIGTGLLLYVVILIIILNIRYYYLKNHFTFSLKWVHLRVSWVNMNISVFQVFCMYYFDFDNHNQIMNILSELESPSINKLVKITSFIELIICLFVMYLGYFSSLDEEKTNEINIDRSI